MKPIPSSHSSHLTFGACPRRYLTTLVLADGNSDAMPLRAGRIGHRIADAYARTGEILDPADDPEYDSAAGAWLQGALDGLATLGPEVIGEVQASELALAIDDQGRPVPFDSDERAYRGILDILSSFPSGARVVTDWKMGYRMDPDFDQVLGYAALGVLAGKVPLDRPIFLRIIYPRFGEGGIHMRSEPVSRDEMGKAMKRALATARKIRALDPDDVEQWKPTPGAHCGDCPAILTCEAARLVAVGPAPVSAAAAEEAWNMKAAYKAAADALDQQVRDYVEAHGPFRVAGGKKEVSFYSQPSWKVANPSAILEALVAEEVAVEAIYDSLPLSKTWVEEQAKALPKPKRTAWVKEMLAKHGTWVPGQRFEARQAPKDPDPAPTATEAESPNPAAAEPSPTETTCEAQP